MTLVPSRVLLASLKEGWKKFTNKRTDIYRRPNVAAASRPNAGARLTETIERIRWRLWRGQVKRALDLIAETVVTVAVAADDKSPIAAAARKVARLLGDLETYASGQSDIIIDYVTARRCEEPISTAITESTVQWLLHRRMAAQQQMLVSKGRSFDAESPDLRRERYARPGLRRRGALGSPAISASSLTTPTFRTVSEGNSGHSAGFKILLIWQPGILQMYAVAAGR